MPKHAASSTAQPLPRHYNGQGVLRPSLRIDLGEGDFAEQFQTMWDEHVNFGTAKSHKKLARRDAQQQMEWRARLHDKRDRESAQPAAAPKSGKKRRRAEGAAQAEQQVPKAQAAQPRPQPTQPKPQPAKAALPSKGRWDGCLAAKLLGA